MSDNNNNAKRSDSKNAVLIAVIGMIMGIYRTPTAPRAHVDYAIDVLWRTANIRWSIESFGIGRFNRTSNDDAPHTV